MLRAAGDDEPVSGLDLQRGLPFHQNFALAFLDVANLFARMRMPARRSPRSQLDANDNRLAPRNSGVAPLYDRTLKARVLRPKRGAGDGHQCQPIPFTHHNDYSWLPGVRRADHHIVALTLLRGSNGKGTVW